MLTSELRNAGLTFVIKESALRNEKARNARFMKVSMATLYQRAIKKQVAERAKRYGTAA